MSSSTSVQSQQLSREEMLAKWKKEKEAKRKGKKSLDKRKSTAKTPTSRRTPISRVSTGRKTPAGRLPRESIQSKTSSAPLENNAAPAQSTKNKGPKKPVDHSIRARQVLHERNYSTRSNVAASRKRTLSDRSPCKKPSLVKRSSFTGKGAAAATESLFRMDSDVLLGLSISVRSSSITQSIFSPLSISGLSQDPSPRSSQVAVWNSNITTAKDEVEKEVSMESPLRGSTTGCKAEGQVQLSPPEAIVGNDVSVGGDCDANVEEKPPPASLHPDPVEALEQHTAADEDKDKENKDDASAEKFSFYFDEDHCSPRVAPTGVAAGDKQSKATTRRSSLSAVPEKSAPSFFFDEDISPSTKLKSRARRSSLAIVPQRVETSSHEGTDSPKPSFSFEEDSAEDDQLPRRRRMDATFLLLPTPSPFDPVSDSSLQPSPTSAFSKVASPLSIVHDSSIVEEKFSKLAVSLKGEEMEGIAKTATPKKAALVVKVEGNEVEVAFEKDATLQLSPTSAFSSVSPSDVKQTVTTTAPQEIAREADLSEPSASTTESSITSDSAALLSSPVVEGASEEEQHVSAVDQDELSEEEDIVEPFLPEPIKMNDRTVLESVEESAKSPKSLTSPKSPGVLQHKYKAVLTENTTLRNRLSNIRKSYEERVTPFRDVFEDERKLRAQNKQMKQVNQKILVQNQQLRKQKEEVDKMVAMLQTQMVTSLQAAVQNSTQLKQSLEEANAKIKRLEEALRQTT